MTEVERVLRAGVRWPKRLEYRGDDPVGGPGPDFRAWHRAVDPDDAGLFARRLAWDGLTAESAQALLVDCPYDPRPEWLPTLEALRAAAVSSDRADPVLCDVPFDLLLTPLVEHAWGGLREVEGLPALGPAACDALRRQLGHRLAAVTAHAFYRDFRRTRPAGRTVMLEVGMSTGRPSSDRYRQWCRDHLADGLWDLLEQFPVMGRLLATTVMAWQQATAALITRVHAHRADLQRAFGVSPEAPVTGLVPGLSDSHRGGHSVAVLDFEGTRVVYKPKDLRLELAFNLLVGDVNTWFGDDALAEIVVVPGRGGYGFTSFIEHQQCPPDALADFYRSAGRLLAMLYLFGVTDAHVENVIAHGSKVALIDPETLLQDLPGEPDESLRDTVLATGMLPAWALSGPGQFAYDVSALGATLTEAEGRGWAHINTDDMVFTRVPAPSRPLMSIPTPGNPLPDHVDSLVAGFAQMHRACREEGMRGRLLEALRAFQGLPRRVVLRSTAVYATTLLNAADANSLTNANARAMHFERLTRNALLAGEREPLWLVFQAELADLENGDIPFFEQAIGSGVVHGALGPIAGLVTADAISEATGRIMGADDADLRWQESLIRGSIAARWSTVDQTAPMDVGGSQPGAQCPDPITPGQLLAQMLRARIPDRSDLTWLTLSRLPDGQHVRLGLTGEDWYDGRIGIAAALDYVSGSDLGTSAPMQRILRHTDPYLRRRYLRDHGLGLTGLGGIVRWLMLTAPEQLDELIEAIPLGLVNADRVYDVIGGVAGLIGPLARHLRERPSRAGLRLLNAAADHLLAAQLAEGGWPTVLGPRPLTGMAHGAAGCGLGLLEAGHLLSRDELVVAGARAFSYETYDPALGNWPDLRPAATAPAMTAWCHGAPGIGLTRLRALDLFADHAHADQWRLDVERAMMATAGDPLPATDHLCCGLAGRAAILRIAGRTLDEERWMRASQTLTDELRDRHRRWGRFHFPADDPRNPVACSPGLMSGVAGVATHLQSLERDHDLRWWLL